MRKSWKRIAVTAALAGTASVAISAPAWANGTTRYQNASSLACLDSGSASGGTGPVYTQGCNTGNYQKWNYIQINSESWYLQDVATGLYLAANSSDTVYTEAKNSGTNLEWRRVLDDGSSTKGQWINDGTGRCLAGATSGAGTQSVNTSSCDAQDRKKWIKIG